MANKARGEIALKLGGKTYVLRPSFGAVCEIEDALGTNLFDLGRRLERAEIAARDLVKLAHACLAQSGHAVKEDELGELILEHGAVEVIAALARFCQAYAFGGHEEKKAGAPSRPVRDGAEYVREYMKVALGRLGWPPAVFWAATPHEFWAAFEDWAEVNCVRRDDGTLSEDEIARLEAMKRRFPD